MFSSFSSSSSSLFSTPPLRRPATAMPIPLDALVSFHVPERRLFSRMVVNLGANSMLAMEIIAFWMWLEEAGHPSVIRPILHLRDDDHLRRLAVEAKRCLAGLRSGAISYSCASSCSSPVSLTFVERRSHYALRGIIEILQNVCLKIFEDLIVGLANLNLIDCIRSRTSMLFSEQQQKGMQSKMKKEVPRDERTLFVTFSNGYPLKEEDLHEFFAREFGAVEVIYIQQVVPGDEPLFARIVFDLPETILLVLNGDEKVKFVIKGRHVWARRYIPKKKRRSTTTSTTFK